MKSRRLLTRRFNVPTVGPWVAVGATCLLAQGALGNLLFTEGFNYNTGGLGGQGPWTGGNNNIQITASSLTYPGLDDTVPSGNDVTITSGVSAGSAVANFNGSATTSGSIFYSFIAECTALPTANNYLTSLLNTGSTGPSGSGDPLAVYFGQQTAGSTYKIGVRHQGVGSGATYTSGAWATLNSVNLFVVEYTFGSGGSVSLFVNPTPGGAMPTADVTVAAGGTEATGLQEVGFKAQAAATAGNWIFDSLRVGSAWGDVVPSTIPEPSTLTLAGLGLAGLILSRRNRK